MAAELLLPTARATDGDSRTYSGAKWIFYASGTTTPQAVYADAGLSTSLGSIVTADSGGKFVAIYFDAALLYRGVCEDATGSTNLHDIDPINSSIINELSGSGGSALVGFIQSGTGAVERVMQDKAREIKSLPDQSTPELAFANKTGVTHYQTVPIGTYTLAARIPLVAYSHISGQGDMSRIMVPASTKGFAYTSQTGVFDDHPHNLIKDLRVSGDGTFVAYPGAQTGTSTGVSFAEVDFIGSLGCVQGTVLELHDTGRYIKSSFGHVGRRNYYRANKIGLKLENVTSFTEYDIYARYNSTAAVHILGGQNVSLRGGAIEGNPGKAIEYVDNGATWGQINIEDVYFETNGDQAAGVPSIDIPFTSPVMVNIKGGSYWTNTASGKTSGPYRLGPSVAMDGATINGVFYAKEVTSFRNCRGPAAGVWNTFSTEALSRLYGLTAPALFHEFKPAAYEPVFTSASTTGLIIGCKAMGRGAMRLPTMPNIANLTYPYSFTASGGASGAVNAALNYGEGDWWKVTYAASIGTFSTNYATLATFPDNTKPFRTFCALLRPDVDTELGFVMSVGGQSITGYYKLLAGVTYRIIFAAVAPMSAANSVLRMFPLDASAPAISVLPIWMGQCATYLEQIKAIELLVEGNL